MYQVHNGYIESNYIKKNTSAITIRKNIIWLEFEGFCSFILCFNQKSIVIPFRNYSLLHSDHQAEALQSYLTGLNTLPLS